MRKEKVNILTEKVPDCHLSQMVYWVVKAWKVELQNCNVPGLKNGKWAFRSRLSKYHGMSYFEDAFCETFNISSTAPRAALEVVALYLIIFSLQRLRHQFQLLKSWKSMVIFICISTFNITLRPHQHYQTPIGKWPPGYDPLECMVSSRILR